ncbi:alpha/beta-hydrolase [Aureobasidium pullulans]|uniref:Alpha/beta-hydrolase n=1 Tax=Aureobasidium pullulans TaxID=5580 RepID=A0A4S9AVI1_AURPU|nr:alpha/beta-hydrolase [Aureobasidium pullulans]
MTAVKSDRLQYCTDDFGNPIYARVCWEPDTSTPKPIVIILHAGGFVIGSDAMIPQVQIDYLTSHNFVVVIPNYRLCPQVSALKGAIPDTHASYDFCKSTLGPLCSLPMTSTWTPQRSQLWASVTVLYPSLYLSQPSLSRTNEPYNLPPYNQAPEFTPTPEDWNQLCPPDKQISEAGLPIPGTQMSIRVRFMINLLKTGTWNTAITSSPEELAALDPCSEFTDAGAVWAVWPPTFFIQGDLDETPGSRIDLVVKAADELRNAGADYVEVEIVQGARHMFDAMPGVGTQYLEPSWLAVKKGLDFLISRC